MSSCGIMEGGVGAPEQLCYIPCNFCNIVLAVSVPCSSMFDTVTVRCGHCANLWSVNMAAAFHQSLSSSSASSWLGQHRQDHHLHLIQQQAAAPNNNYTAPEYRIDLGSSSSSKCSSNNKKMPLRPSANTKAAAADRVHRPPEKRQRVPSAYNQFIKEEIQRIKANNPDISHREAFSTAAKNWAHYPHIHFGLMLETSNQPNKLDDASGNRLCSMSRASLRNK